MAKRPRRNDATRPGQASSAWNTPGWYRVYHGPRLDWEAVEDGMPKKPAARRQGGFPRPLLGLHYHRPPAAKKDREPDPMVEMRRRQAELARELGILPPLKSRRGPMTYAEKEAAKLDRNKEEFASIKAQVEVGSVSPVRRKQLRDGFLSAGLDHLLS